MRNNKRDRIDEFFKEFRNEIDTHFDKVFILVDDLKMDSYQNQRRLSRQIMNKAET